MKGRASKSPPRSFNTITNSNSNSFPSPSLNSSPSDASSGRCKGLDLLVLAAIEIFGIGVWKLEHVGSNGVGEEGKQKRIQMEGGLDGGVVDGLMRKRTRQLAVPSRYQDSVLQPWKRRTRRRSGGANQ